MMILNLLEEFCLCSDYFLVYNINIIFHPYGFQII